MVEKTKYFRNKSNTGWLRYIIADTPFTTKDGAMNCARGMRNMGGKARVVKDEKTGKYLCYAKMI